MNRVHFLLGVHNHQPIGNFDFVFEKAYSLSYSPFLEAMERHPNVHWNLHATGILWEWLEKHHPDYVDRVAEQARQGRVEILTGGYYEPILPALPDVDKRGQIQKLSRYIRQRFGVEPRGMWLAERVWEPHLAKVLSDCGIEYTLVDDAHFISTGMTEDQLAGSFLTEEQGATLKLLPIRKDLRYAIPFKDPGETLNALRRFASPTAYKALVMFDDGEKFGLWPETQDHVYKGGWLENFLTVLESNGDWIYSTRISDYLKMHVPQGRVYLPTASYYEMSEWTLPAESQGALTDAVKTLQHSENEDAVRFMRGGFWRNFLTKYDESNNLHKKMLYVAEKVHRAVGVVGDELPKRLLAKHQKALDFLWAGQCNCAYWHGVFGGLYLPHLRQALYRNLLAAERAADELEKDAPETTTVFEDLDKDGLKEVLIEAPEQNLYVAPHAGGSVFEWDLRSRGLNMLNTLTRRAEGYHRQLKEVESQAAAQSTTGAKTIHDVVRVKEPALERRLHTDWYRRASLLDHFLHPDTTLDQFFRCQYGEQGDFVKTGYDPVVLDKSAGHVRLSRTGSVWTGEQVNRISVEKTLSLTPGVGWQVAYRLQNVDGPAVPLWWGCEMNFAFGTPERIEPVSMPQVTRWDHRDGAFALRANVQFDLPTDVWEFPLQTVSLSEEGFERTYQGTVLLALTRLTLKPGQAFVRSWRVGIESA